MLRTRFYAVTLAVTVRSHWPEPALMLPDGERIEDYIGDQDRAREITRDDFYSRPALSRYTRPSKRG